MNFSGFPKRLWLASLTALFAFLPPASSAEGIPGLEPLPGGTPSSGPSVPSPPPPSAEPPRMVTYSPKEKPEKLFQAFVTAYHAKEQWKASLAAQAMVHQCEQALPILSRLLQFIRAAPTGTVEDEQASVYWDDAVTVVASIGPTSAAPLAEMISAGEVRSDSHPVGFIAAGTQVVGGPSPVTEDIIAYSVPVSRFDTLAKGFELLSVEGLPALPKLLDLTESPSAEIRAEACRCIAPMGPLASMAIRRLRALCDDSDAHCRRQALGALARVEMDSASLMPILEHALSDASPEVRGQALDIIAVIGKPAASLSDPLLGMIEHADLDPPGLGGATERFLAPGLDSYEIGKTLKALRSVGLADATQCDRLVDSLARDGTKNNPEVCRSVADILSHQGATARPAIKRWVAATAGADDSIQIAAFLAAFNVRPGLLELSPEAKERCRKLMDKLPPERSFRDWMTGSGPQPVYSPLQKEILTLRNASGAAAVEAGARAYVPSSQQEFERLVQQFSTGDQYQRCDACRLLGWAGPKAAVAVPTLENFVQSWKFSLSPRDLNVVEACYVALASITGEPDRWIHDAEARILNPMLALSKRDNWAMTSFTVTVKDMGGSRALPHLIRFMNGADAAFAKEAMDTVVVMSDADWAVQSLPVILQSRFFDVDDHYMFAQFVGRAGPLGAPAMDVLIHCLEKYRRQTTDAAELEKLRSCPWSRYGISPDDRLRDLLAAIRAIGGAEARKALPVLLKIYDEEPLPKDLAPLYGKTLRCEILETLRFLGTDMKQEAARWIPQLQTPLETEYQVRDNILELGAFGRLGLSAMPALIRYTRLHPEYRREALDALAEIAPDDARVKALRQVARFEPQH